jgi:hypothetical protein
LSFGTLGDVFAAKLSKIKPIGDKVEAPVKQELQPSQLLNLKPSAVDEGQVVGELLDYLQKNGFLSARVNRADLQMRFFMSKDNDKKTL